MREKELTGRVYDIQGFSVHDGPGIRTTAFLKGCPLRCPWCHSPESQSYEKQLCFISMRCQGVEVCRSRCIKACPKNAVELGGKRADAKTGGQVQMIHVDRARCDNCGACDLVCYPDALYICGRDYTVCELVERLERDKAFYAKSGGGVTISGGECLMQADFTSAILKMLKEKGINTAVDTTGFAPWETVARVLPYTDLFLYDIKHMDSEKHKAAVGVPNELILENAVKIAENGGKLQIRVPVIPMFNSGEENIRETAQFCKALGSAVQLIQLLPYHNLGVMKYLRIGDDPVAEAVPPSDKQISRLKEIMEQYGLPVTVH